MSQLAALQVPSPGAKTLPMALSMRAVVRTRYGGPDAVHTGEVPRPVPAAGQVLVKVHAAGVDRGTWHLMTGRPYPMRLAGFGVRAPRRPVLGMDLAGTVVALGPGATRFREGDVVFGLGDGSFAEFCCAPQHKVTHVPDGMPLTDAAVLGVSGITAVQALKEEARVQPGEHVLVVGASGGVGVYAVQVARALGAQVTAVCSGTKAARVRALGAHRVVDYRTTDFTAEGVTYDAILDIGGNTPLKALRRALKPEGRLVFVGAENVSDWTGGFGRQLAALMLAPWVRQRFVMMLSREHHDLLDALVALYRKGHLQSVVERRVGLDGVRGVLADMEAGRLTGKTVVVP